MKIADFGVSVELTHTYACVTSWVGTVTYMSPERIQGQSYYADTDLWSLGIILVECAWGRYPYPDPDDEIEEVGFWELLKYITEKPSPKLGSEYSEAFQDFVSICLRKQASTRSSASELLKHPFVKKFEKTDKK